MTDSTQSKRVRRQHVTAGPQPRYWRVWVDEFCVADGIGPVRAWLLATAIRWLGR